jgi:signal transduction histidine kinase
MNFGIRFRLVVLGLGLGLMGTLIVLIILSSQRQVSELRARLNNVDSETSGITDHFQASLRELNSDMLRYGTDRNSAIWDRGFHTGLELDVWIEQQKSVLQSPEEKNLLGKIQSAYDNYLAALENFHHQVESQNGRSISLADFTTVREQSQKLFDLGQALARAHYKTHNELLRHANRSLKALNFSMLMMVGLLFIFGTGMAIVVYRQLIAPLHVQLVESRTFAERHEKLASLGLMASGVAQEVRNPLTSIKIGVRFQKNNFPAGSTEWAEAEVVETEIRRLEQILDHFLTMTQLATPQPAPLPLDNFLQELRHWFTPQLAKANIQLVTETFAPMRVCADASQLRQVIINLVQFTANAIGSNGCITLRAHPDQRLLAGREIAVAVLEVADTGRGADSEMERYSIPPSLTALADDVGMGLSIAAQIIRKNGGEMLYLPQTNCGLVFGVVLPRI